MKAGFKILIGAGVAGVAAIFIFHKPSRDKATKAVKKAGSFLVGDLMIETPGDADLAKGSGDVQHVLQVQQALNQLHYAVQYINANCNAQWSLYKGTMPGVSGVFDQATEDAMLFYLNRKTIDLDYLNMIRDKLAKYEAGDKCKYPLSY